MLSQCTRQFSNLFHFSAQKYASNSFILLPLIIREKLPLLLYFYYTLPILVTCLLPLTLFDKSEDRLKLTPELTFDFRRWSTCQPTAWLWRTTRATQPRWWTNTSPERSPTLTSTSHTPLVKVSSVPEWRVYILGWGICLHEGNHTSIGGIIFVRTVSRSKDDRSIINLRVLNRGLCCIISALQFLSTMCPYERVSGYDYLLDILTSALLFAWNKCSLCYDLASKVSLLYMKKLYCTHSFT